MSDDNIIDITKKLMKSKEPDSDYDAVMRHMQDAEKLSLMEIAICANNITKRLGPLEAISILIIQAAKMTEYYASVDESKVGDAISAVVRAYYEGNKEGK